MADIKPFRGFLYDRNRVNLPDVVAPPYDVISPAQQAALYDRHPANITRLILGREEDRYSSAAKFYADWKRLGILVRDDAANLYILAQSFELPDKRKVERRGFIAACRLEDLGKGSIVPHEKTLSKPKEDRFRLFFATRAMFSQIFSLYRDTDGVLDPLMRTAMKRPPEFDVESDHVRNRMWRVSDSSIISSFASYIAGQRIYVADGHHRYETALLYRDAMRLRHPNGSGDEPFNYIPMFFTNMTDPGLVILPTHRIVHGIAGFDRQDFLSRLDEHFRITPLESLKNLLDSLRARPSGRIGIVLSDRPGFYLADVRRSAQAPGETGPEVLRDLDVTLLHNLIMNKLLGMTDEDQVSKRNLDYIRDESEALDAVVSGKAQAAFLLNPTPVELVRKVAESGLTMPQKSTYFYPKLLSGTVIYDFGEW
ncbi:MAG TPA: DUF1015 domain-containing protein [Bacteroidota bacterium]|nr:DUF1015 domain-containing protein [Bacteroidota bacterium]